MRYISVNGRKGVCPKVVKLGQQGIVDIIVQILQKMEHGYISILQSDPPSEQ